MVCVPVGGGKEIGSVPWRGGGGEAVVSSRKGSRVDLEIYLEDSLTHFGCVTCCLNDNKAGHNLRQSGHILWMGLCSSCCGRIADLLQFYSCLEASHVVARSLCFCPPNYTKVGSLQR